MSVQVDLTQFNAAMLRYKKETGKTLEESCNRSLKNLIIHAVKGNYIRQAQRASIEAIRRAPWFNKYITKLLGHKFTPSKARKVTQKGMGLSGRKSTTDYRIKWDKLANAIIKKRVRAIKFLTKLMASCSRVIPAKNAKSAGWVAKIPGSFAYVKVATQMKPTASISFGFDYKNSRKRVKSSGGAERIMGQAIRKAVPETVKDMEQYIANKLRKKYKQ